MKKNVLFLIVMAFILMSCEPHVADVVAPEGVEPAGFWLGLWHGIIAPITFIWSLFNHDVTIYEMVNNGAWYNFGFVLGSGILFKSSSSS